MGSFVVAGKQAEEYPTRLRELERRQNLVEWILVVPGIIQFVWRRFVVPWRKRRIIARVQEDARRAGSSASAVDPR